MGEASLGTTPRSFTYSYFGDDVPDEWPKWVEW